MQQMYNCTYSDSQVNDDDSVDMWLIHIYWKTKFRKEKIQQKWKINQPREKKLICHVKEKKLHSTRLYVLMFESISNEEYFKYDLYQDTVIRDRFVICKTQFE